MRTTRQSLLGAFGLLCVVPMQAQPGALDLSFNSSGYVVQPVNTGDGVQKILVQPDQKILTLGMSWDATFTARAYVFRYLPDGTPDTDFASNGMFTYALDNEALFYSAALTPTGKILLVGSTTNYENYRMLLVQLNSDGTPDDSFGDNGVVLQSVALVDDHGEDFAYDVAFDAVGNILVCGNSHDPNYVRRPVVVRFTASGVLDTAFGDGGVATIPVNAVGSSAFMGIAVQPDGKIVATGYFGQTELWYLLLVARFNADGTLDESFSDDGIVKHNYGNVDDAGEDLEFTADGSILIAGKTTTATYNYSALIMKFTSSGEVDESFGDAGAVEEDVAQFDYAWELAQLPGGDIIVAGTAGNGPPDDFDLAVWKYKPDGTPANDFGNAGFVQHMIPDYYTMIYGLAIQADGKILVGGQARTTVNENYFFVARLGNSMTGIVEPAANATVVVVPNPTVAGASIALRVAEPLGANVRVALHALDGSLVFASSTRVLERGSNAIRLALPADLAPGMYQLSILRPDHALSTARVVVE